MVVVSWRSLATYYLSLLERETPVPWRLYSEVGEGRGRRVELWSPDRESHVIICYPSLCRLDPDVTYSLIARRRGWALWLDESVRLSHSSASVQMLGGEGTRPSEGTRMEQCESRLTDLVRAAPFCVMLQYNMMQDAPCWILDRLGMSIEGAVSSKELRTIRLSEEYLWRGRTFLYTTKPILVYASMRAAVLGGYPRAAADGSVESARTTVPVYCVCNYARTADFVACWLRKEAEAWLVKLGWKEPHVSDALRRIRHVRLDVKAGKTEEGQYARMLFEDTNACAREADVLVVTYVAEAGVSIPRGHFRAVFGVLFPAVGTWDSQLQSLNRVREEVFTMVSFAKDKTASAGAHVCRAVIRHTLGHQFRNQAPWTVEAAVGFALDAVHLRTAGWVMWQDWLRDHPWVAAVCVDDFLPRTSKGLTLPPMVPSARLFWDHWPVPTDDTTQQRLSTTPDAVKEGMDTSMRHLSDAVAQHLTSGADLTALADTGAQSVYGLSVDTNVWGGAFSGRVSALTMHLSGIARTTLTGLTTDAYVSRVVALVPILGCLSGSGFATFLEKAKSGLAYFRFLERKIRGPHATTELRTCVTPLENAKALFLQHVLRGLHCPPCTARSPNGTVVHFYLPDRLHGITSSKDDPAHLRTVMKSWRPMSLGGRDTVRWRDMWDLLTNYSALPDAPPQPPRKTRCGMNECIRMLMQAYGLQYVFSKPPLKTAPGLHAGRACRPGTEEPRRKHMLVAHEEGWQQTLAFMQVLALSQNTPLHLDGMPLPERCILRAVNDHLGMTETTM